MRRLTTPAALPQVHFVWSVRDRAMLGAMDESSQLPSLLRASTQAKLPISFTPDLLSVSAQLSVKRPASPPPSAITGVPAAEADGQDGGRLLSSEYFLTQVRCEEDFHAGNIHPDTQQHVRFGRPDLPAVFGRMARTAARLGESRVAVLVCGPRGMVDTALPTITRARASPSISTCEESEF